jgi:hypothetical protein
MFSQVCEGEEETECSLEEWLFRSCLKIFLAGDFEGLVVAD